MEIIGKHQFVGKDPIWQKAQKDPILTDPGNTKERRYFDGVKDSLVWDN